MANLAHKSLFFLMIGAVLSPGAQPIYAHDETPGDQPPRKGSTPALPGRPIGEESYSGPTWEYEPDTSACTSHEGMCPEHWSLRPHYHYVDRITGRYDGYYDLGAWMRALIGSTVRV